MGIFSKCDVCGKSQRNEMHKYQYRKLCDDCYAKIYVKDGFEFNTTSAIQEHIKYRDGNHQSIENFVPSRVFDIGGFTIYVNDSAQLVYWLGPNEKRDLAIFKGYDTTREPYIFKFDDILSYGYYQNEAQIRENNGAFNAAVYGVMFGAVGAIAGGLSASDRADTNITGVIVGIAVSNPYIEGVTLNFLDGVSKSGSQDYVAAKNNAEEFIRLLDNLLDRNLDAGDGQIEKPVTSQLQASVSDELMKLKSLLDDGIIDESEFTEMKQRLISQM